jgi:hypothetical protein
MKIRATSLTVEDEMNREDRQNQPVCLQHRSRERRSSCSRPRAATLTGMEAR